VKFAFIDAEKWQWPVNALCEMLEVSRSGYYAWTTRVEAPKVKADAEVVAVLAITRKRGKTVKSRYRLLAST
jgi:putative transposase